MVLLCIIDEVNFKNVLNPKTIWIAILRRMVNIYRTLKMPWYGSYMFGMDGTILVWATEVAPKFG